MGKQWARQQVKSNELATVVDRAALWVKYHPQTALWGGIGFIAGVLLIVALVNRQRMNREEAWGQLSTATAYAYQGQAPQALEEINKLAQTHPASNAEGYGLLLAGDLLFQQSKFPDAVKAYQRVLDNPVHATVLPFAQAGLGFAQEAGGNCQASTGTTQAFLDQYQDHFLAPQVHASLARCLSALGDGEKAKATAQRMEVLYPNTYWATWAQARKG